MDKLRSAVIGCGRIGCEFDDSILGQDIRTHAKSYFKYSKTNLIALCDIDSKKLKKYGTKFKVKGLYTNSLKMFQSKKIDCVSICTHLDSHLELVKQACSSGVKGIFIEKPISYDLISAKKIIELCKKSNTVLLVDHQRRFNPLYHSIKKIIKQNEIGKIYFVNIYYGSGIANTGSHIFDLLRFLFGEIRSLKSNKTQILSANPLDPNLDVKITFKNKLIAFMKALNTTQYGIFEIDIIGENGRIKLDYSQNKAQLLKPKKGLVYNELRTTTLKENNVRNLGPYLGVQNLVECILYEKKPLCSGQDGYKALELITASILSAKRKKEIFLPLKMKNFKIHSQ